MPYTFLPRLPRLARPTDFRARRAASSPPSDPVRGNVAGAESRASTALTAPAASRRARAGYSDPNDTPLADPSVAARRFFSS